jgi:cytochrome P450
MKVLKGMMKERMADPDRKCEDFFDHVIQELRREKPLLTETIALDLMFVLLFASFETTALALTLGVKLLTENPKVVDALMVSTSTVTYSYCFTQRDRPIKSTDLLERLIK